MTLPGTFRTVREEEIERMLHFAKAVAFPKWQISREYKFNEDVINVYFEVLNHGEEEKDYVNGFVTPLTIHEGMAHTRLILQPCLMLDNWRRIRALVLHEMAHILQIERYADEHNLWFSYNAKVGFSHVVVSEMSAEDKETISKTGIPEEGIELESKLSRIKGGMHGKAYRIALGDMKERAIGIKI
jgi:hypothetical protein